MFTRCTASVFAITAFLASPAAAQQGAPAIPQGNPATEQRTAPPGAAAAPAGAGQINFLTTPPPGVWQAGNIIGEDIYGQDDQKVGTVKDLLVSPRGLVLALVVDLEGSQKMVAVPAAALQSLGADVATTAATSTQAGGQTAQAAKMDRLTLQLTAQQVKAAPEFKPSAQKQ